MNRLELLEKTQQLTDETKIRFYLGDKEISNRFDRNSSHQYKPGDTVTTISFALYSYIANAIILKAQGEEKAKEGYLAFDQEWESIISQCNIKINPKIQKDEALHFLHSFLFSKNDITLVDLIEKISFICLIKTMKERNLSYRKISHLYHKKKDVIINQVTLYSRSLYHSFLNRKDLDSQKIDMDKDNLSNGILLYDHSELFIPTWQNAFHIEDYKSVIKHGLSNCSSTFPLTDVNRISVLYMIKDITATYEI